MTLFREIERKCAHLAQRRVLDTSYLGRLHTASIGVYAPQRVHTVDYRRAAQQPGSHKQHYVLYGSMVTVKIER